MREKADQNVQAVLDEKVSRESELKHESVRHSARAENRIRRLKLISQNCREKSLWMRQRALRTSYSRLPERQTCARQVLGFLSRKYKHATSRCGAETESQYIRRKFANYNLQQRKGEALLLQ